ncbi:MULTISPECIES: hypothetical protein [unclassified Caballeronia]|uniref:hypothetical protein n=1 Tax=unclassified Caballeronia TaxID=2646786 RepID=UPI002029100E|nr:MULTISPECIES: hypothetical protein [unclassified Caballeronia]
MPTPRSMVKTTMHHKKMQTGAGSDIVNCVPRLWKSFLTLEASGVRHIVGRRDQKRVNISDTPSH